MHLSITRLALGGALACLFLASSASAQEPTVLVVDASGGGDYVEIADALPHTHAGWTVLVRPGVYQLPVTLTNQSCSIVADGTGAVVLTQRLVVEELGGGRRVTLSGLELELGFLVRDCAGPVLIQGCTTLDPAVGMEIPPGTTFPDWPDCGAGTSRHQVKGSGKVTFVECRFRGADGGFVNPFDALPGQHALELQASFVALYHCELVGGDGHDGTSGHYDTDGGAGGDGIHSEDELSLVRLHETLAVGGQGGAAGGSGAYGGCDGIPIRHPDPRRVAESNHPTIAFGAPVVLVGGQPAELVVDGIPGTPVLLLSSSESFWRVFPPSLGILHLAQPVQITSLGPIPASGRLVSPFTPNGPSSPTGFESLHLQILGLNSGSRFLSEPRRAVVVDPSL